MSKVGCPYDNAPIERFYNTFKNSFYYVTSFSSVEVMDELTSEYINWYNYVRPHSYNDYLTPMPAFKKLLLKVAGRKYDQMAAKKNQSYYFIFVHEDGAGLERISEIFAERHIEASVDEVFSLDEVNSALQKVAAGKSKGKTILSMP